jgi:protein-disulfide isomerase-like protein with CxxC motif
MQTTDLHDLRAAVERIRKTQHPDLDSEFLDAVILAEDANPEDDAAAIRAIQAALKVVISESGAL